MNQKSRIKCVIFDMDGTIVDVPYDWTQIKKELNTGGKPILNYLEQLEEPERTKKWNILKSYEKKATQKAVLKKDIIHFLDFIKKNDILSALVTNNSRENVSFLLKRFDLEFDLVMTRESGLWKPSAEPFFEVMERFSLDKEECCVIGDSQFDIMAATEAGIQRIFIIHKDVHKFRDEQAEVYESFKALKNRITQIIL